MNDSTGRILDGKYKLLRLLGEGGMGSVYKAQHIVLKRKVAVKIMHPQHSAKEGAVDRFVREAQAASAIGHPNIVEAFDIGKDKDGTVYIVMELPRGVSLEDTLAEQGTLSVDHAVLVLAQVLSALNAAHDKGIIHRDLKPDNVFLAFNKRGRQEIKLLDFGVAKFRGESYQDINLTAPGTVLGTPKYLSPEQARGNAEIDHRIDLWAIGVMLYQMLSGEVPFPGETYNEIISRILLDPHPPLREIAPDLPYAICSFVDRALAKDRNERFSSASEMLQELVNMRGETISMMSDAVAIAVRQTLSNPPHPTYSENLPPLYSAPTVNGEERLDRFACTRPSESAEALYETADIALSASTTSIVSSVTPTEWNEDPAHKKPVSSFKRSAFFLGGVAGLALIGLGLSTLLNHNRAGRASRQDSLDTTSGTPVKTAPQETEPSGVSPKRSEVTVGLAGLPEGARILLNGRPVSLPLVQPPSKTPFLLSITAPSHLPLETTIVFDEDKVVEVEMKREAAPPADQLKKKKKKKKKNLLLDNPFGG